jgi:hypothetical protein
MKSHSDRRRSGLEHTVEAQLQALGYQPEYEAERINYRVPSIRRYVPDYRIGDVYIEVKGLWTPADRAKFLNVIASNPRLRIFVALQRPSQRLSKTSDTTYAEWATRNGVCWCPIPIPDWFLRRWIQGETVSFSPSQNG